MADKPIHMLYWLGNFMGYSYDKEELHNWAKNLDSTWEDGEGEEGTNYQITTAYPGFEPDTDDEEFEIITSN